MKIAILGGGFTGLTAGYELARAGHEITIYEKQPVLGGLAAGFKASGWEWPLEHAYHHLFASDHDILQFAQELGFSGIFFRIPHTDSLYPPQSGDSDNYRIFPVDTPQDFLRFPLLPWLDKIRAAAVLAFLRFSPFLPFFEHITAEKFIKMAMGQKVWIIWWEQLFRKKFGKYAGKILLSWFWSRIYKRTQQLGYIEGGFQTFVQFLETKNKHAGVQINVGYTVTGLRKIDNEFELTGQQGEVSRYDAVISTLPTAVLVKTTQGLLPQEYLNRLARLEYLHALVLIIESKEKILDTTYWLNICDKETPLMVVAQHTNFIEPTHYGGNELCYIGYYLERNDPLMSMTKEQVFEYLSPYLSRISGRKITPLNLYLFQGPFAQPIFNAQFVKNKPDFITPVPRFYIANLDMTYPHDRGTNYAVKLGREVAAIVR